MHPPKKNPAGSVIRDLMEWDRVANQISCWHLFIGYLGVKIARPIPTSLHLYPVGWYFSVVWLFGTCEKFEEFEGFEEFES